MSGFRANIAVAAALIAVVFGGLIAYSVRVAPQMGRDSKRALDSFYAKCRARDFAGARALCSADLREGLSAAQLQREWTKFAAKNGPLTRWEVADKVSIQGFGGSVCLFPPFVDYRHAAFGAKNSGTLIYTRMVPENGGWRVERFNVLRAPGLK